MAGKPMELTIDREQERLLRRLADQQRRPVAEILHDAIEDYLARQGVSSVAGSNGPRRLLPEDEWRSRFAAVVARLQATAPRDLSPDEIEAEITAAWEEARREQPVSRRTAGG